MPRSSGYFNDVRKYNKQQLLNFLKAQPEMDIDKALALFSLQTGLSLGKLRTYYDELKLAELI